MSTNENDVRVKTTFDRPNSWRGEIRSLNRLIITFTVVWAATAAGEAQTGDVDVLVIKAGRIYTMTGDPIEDGIIIVQDGRITAVGSDLANPENAKIVDLSESVVTPGLVDACCAVGFEIPQNANQPVYGSEEEPFWRELVELNPQQGEDEEEEVFDPDGPKAAVEALAAGQIPSATWAEHVSEVTPHRLVLDSINLFSNDFSRLMRGGVTTVFVSPDPANVISSRGAIVKTAGPLSDRIVERASGVKATMGSDPSRRGRGNSLPPSYGPPPTFHTRRPTTRMGVEWIFRKAFSDAQRAQQGLELIGADVPLEEALPVLQKILAGEIQLRIQARMQNDIFSAMRLAQEFSLQFILEEATEAYRCLPQLKAAGVPVIYGPIFMDPTGWRRRSGEANGPRLNTATQLALEGIPFALTAQELRDEEGLLRQAMFATRNGLSREQALRAITTTPAEMMGLAGQVGVVAPGAAADLVAWSCEPLDATSRPLLVMVNGRVEYREKD